MSSLSSFTSKINFFAGVGIALVIIFVAGFILMAAIMLKSTGLEVRQSPGADTASAAKRVSQPPAAYQDDWVRGNRNAAIALIEYSDFECPYCKSFHPTMQRLLDEYPKDVQWIFRHFPLASIHPGATIKAEAAECVGSVGGTDAFWAFTDILFERQTSLREVSQETLVAIANEVGVDTQKVRICIENGVYASKVQKQYNEAIAEGGNGTPYSLLIRGSDRIPISGAVPYSQLESVIKSFLRN